MRISDWSSDVCSSDLGLFVEAAATHEILDVRLHVGVVHEHTGVVHAEGGERGRDVELDAIDLAVADVGRGEHPARSEEHTSELQSLMRISYAVFCLKKKTSRISDTPI